MKPRRRTVICHVTMVLAFFVMTLGIGRVAGQEVSAMTFEDNWKFTDKENSSLMSVPSSLATLTVVDDLTGPKVLSVIADNGFGSRSIRIQFSERLDNASARNRESYQVTRCGSSDFVTITNVLYNSTLGALLRLDASDTNWVQYDDYVVTINNVTDLGGNGIAPSTRVPVSWMYATNLIASSQSWDFHDSAIFDPGVYDEPWFAEDYVPGPWWGQGSGGFFGGPAVQYPCPFIAAPQVAMSYQPEPTLFRTSFQWPVHWPATGNLSLRFGVDDALVVYVNGIESYRYNAAGAAGSLVTSQSRALSTIPNLLCPTNIVLTATNLHSGQNSIAIAVIQSESNPQHSYFVFDMSGSVLLGPELSGEPLPVLHGSVVGSDGILFSWTGSGYALETSESLDLGSLSYPTGPWTEVPQMTNPYVWNLTNGPQRYFRLKR